MLLPNHTRTAYTRRFTIIRTALLLVLSVGSAILSATEKELSPAERAAIESRPATKTDDIVRLCNHTLLYASQEEKDRVIALLNGKTCQEAVAAGFIGN